MYKMNPQSRFTSRAEDYAKYRPSYPNEVIDRLIADLGEPSKLVVADIGAGTGISSRLLADRGVKVMAIEPNAAMRQMAAPHPLVKFGDGNAENTLLSDAAMDLVTCFQSFHWFDPEASLKEFARILKPQGRLAAIWHNRDPERYAERNRNDEFTREYSLLTETASNGDSELRNGTERYLRTTTWFSPIRHSTSSYHQALTREALIGRAMSTSYIPQTGEVCDRFIKDLDRLHKQYGDRQGLVYLQYQTSVYLAELLNT